MKSDKVLTKAELEFTQKLQMHFPCGNIDPAIVQAWNGCPKEFITERILTAFGKMPEVNMLLKRISSFFIQPESAKFIASDRFKVNTGHEAEVKISYLGDNFCKWMLNLVEEQPPAEVNLYYHELLKDSVDGPIIKELGGEQKAETTLSEIFTLMKRQRNGEDGVLLTSGYANIFYVRGANGVLRAVSVGWGGDGWDVRADSVEDPDRWGAGFQVFASNS